MTPPKDTEQDQPETTPEGGVIPAEPPVEAQLEPDASDETPETEQEPVRAVEKTKKGQDEAFPVQRLLDEAEAFFGQPSYIVAGALFAVDKTDLTVSQAQAAIDAWLQAKAS